jgi:hypothetical protein
MNRIATLGVWLVLGFMTYAVLFGPQLAVVFELDRAAREAPELSVKPGTLNTTNCAGAPGTTVSAFGFEFEVPWKEVETRQMGTAAFRVASKEGQVVVLLDPGIAVDSLQTMYSAGSGQADQVRAILGEIKSNFALEEAAVTWTPDQTSFLMSKIEAARAFILANAKRGVGSDARTGIYAVESPGFKGFQYGDPARSRQILVRLFDAQDRQVELTFTRSSSSSPRISQEEINRVIQTLRRTNPDNKQ